MNENEDEKKIKVIGAAFPQWKASSVISRDLAHSLAFNDSFKDDVQKKRRELGVTTLGYKRDFDDAFFQWLDIEDHEADGEPDFHFLRFNADGELTNNEPRQKAIGESALKILKDYKLPANFLYWVINWILFNEAPPWLPLNNYVPIEDKELQTVHKLPLTTPEKRGLKRNIRSINKMLVRNSRLPVNYGKIVAAINESNNPRRRLRNPTRDLKIAEEMGKRRHGKEQVLKDSAYIDVLRHKGYSDKDIKQMAQEHQRLYGESFVTLETRGKYTSRTIEAKFARGKVKKSKGAFARKRFERLKKYVKKKVVN